MIFEEILKAQPDHADSLHCLGIIAIQSNNHQRAVELIGRAITASPNDYGCRLNHGNALKALKQLDAAIASYDRAIAINPDIADAHYNRGVALQELKKLDVAIASYDRAIAIKPDFTAARTNRDLALQEQQNSNMTTTLKEIAEEFHAHPLFNESILVLGAKRTMLMNAKDEMLTLVVGSSHGDFGFDPAHCNSSFNLCYRSLDLKHSYLLYKRSSELCTRINNIVVYYSIFSSGSILEKSPSENEISPAANELFELDIKYDDEKLKKLATGIKEKLGGLSVDLDGVKGFLPKVNIGFFPESYGAERRAAEFMKRNRQNEANVYLTHILSLAKNLGHRVYIVIPPVRSDLKSAIDRDGNLLFKSLFEIISTNKTEINITLLNCYDTDLFLDEHFGDFDHLLPLGAGTQQLSSMINDAINSNLRSQNQAS